VQEKLAFALPALCATGLLMALLFSGAAGAQEQEPVDWRAEFEAVCVKTDLAMTLSSEELADLVARCDRLEERIGAEEEIVRKVFLRRLRSCRSLFVFVLESRSSAPVGGNAPAAAQQTPPAPQPQGEPAPEGRPSP
jgi:hypothetical protein